MPSAMYTTTLRSPAPGQPTSRAARRGARLAVAAAALVVTVGAGVWAFHAPAASPLDAAASPAGDPWAGVTFTIDAGVRWPISRYIYGVNFLTDSSVWGRLPLRGITLNRMGGNRLSTYNWETNWSNAGNDYQYQNDRYLSASATPGEAIRARTAATFARDAAMLVTIPMLGWVAGDASATRLDTTDANRAARLAAHFVASRPFKGAPLANAPDTHDGAVYQDEFVHWLEGAFPAARRDASRRIMYCLDNEPDIWYSTHKEIQSDSGDDPSRPRLLAYDEFADRSIEYARAIKSVAPDAIVFGPSTATWAGMASLGRYANGRFHEDPVHGRDDALGVYLDRMRDAERKYGARLLDVLDVHWYPAASNGRYAITNDYADPRDTAELAEIRMQTPRSLWDAGYSEPHSWVEQAAGGPIRLLRRLDEQIARHYPGTKLAISEYYFGRGGDISGGVAQADLLGIFGRERLFAATLWPNAGVWAKPYEGKPEKAYAYVAGAFRMYRDYDGAGGHFGDTGIAASTSDSVSSSVYASVDGAGRVVIVAINKTAAPLRARIAVKYSAALSHGTAYTLTAASPEPSRGAACSDAPDASCALLGGNAVLYTMPGRSVTTLVLSP